MPCRHYIVEGRVQGVFFRASTREQAQNIGVQGWVRNLPDGRVETLACGSESQLSALELWLRKGPEMAVVSELTVESWQQHEEFTGFTIQY